MRKSPAGRRHSLGNSLEDGFRIAQNGTHISGLKPAKRLVNHIRLEQYLIYFSGTDFKGNNILWSCQTAHQDGLCDFPLKSIRILPRWTQSRKATKTTLLPTARSH